MKFIISESIIQTGNEQKLINELFEGFHILSYVDNQFILSEVESVEEIITLDGSEIVKIKEFDISFSSNYPIVVKDEGDNIILAAFKPDVENVVSFDKDVHRIFDGTEWRKINDFEFLIYTGYAYKLVVKDDYFFLNTVLLSSK